ncbi:hypothetical protein Tco_0117811, partial [Tanacetum coccineum]
RLGIASCDKHGMPVLPPPVKTNETSSWVDVGAGGGDDEGDHDDVVVKKKEVHENRGPNKVVLGVSIGLSAMSLIDLIESSDYQFNSSNRITSSTRW